MISVIETHDLCKSYNGRIVVEHLNLSVPQGCVYGFLGPNGAGKSTSMKILLGLVHPTSGSVKLLGQTMNEENRIALLRKTGSLIESPSGYLHLTARENLKIIADLKDIDHKDIDRVLEIVHLTADANRKVGQYSLGMKQRLGIAMALLGNPRLLILDEPTALFADKMNKEGGIVYVDLIRSRIFFFCGNHSDSRKVWNSENRFRCGDSSENDRSSSVLMADGAGHGDFFWNPQYQRRDAAVSRFVRTGDGSIVAVLFSCAPEYSPGPK